MPFWKRAFSKRAGVYFPQAIVQGKPVENRKALLPPYKGRQCFLVYSVWKHHITLYSFFSTCFSMINKKRPFAT